MSIRRLFDATWDQVYKGAVGYGDSDILTDQRVIIVNRSQAAHMGAADYDVR